jgi:hypothetical protein
MLFLTLWACSQDHPPDGTRQVSFIDLAWPADSSQFDRFTLHGAAAVDVLWVVDPALPDTEVEALLQEFAAVNTTFADSGVAWRTGVVAMSGTPTGQLVGVDGVDWLEAGDPVPFLTTAIGAVLALPPGPPQAFQAVESVEGFFRVGAGTTVVFVGGGGADASADGVAEFAAWVGARWPDQRYASVQAFTGCPGGDSDYTAAVDLLGGGVLALCADLDPVVAAHGLINPEWDYPLTRFPVADTLQVVTQEGGYSIGFDEWDPGEGRGDYTWSASRNAVSFLSYRPPADALLVVEYDPADGLDE